MMSPIGPLQAPRPTALTAGYWGTPVASVTRPTVDSCDSLTQLSSWPRWRPVSKQVQPRRSRSSVAEIDPKPSFRRREGIVRDGRGEGPCCRAPEPRDEISPSHRHLLGFFCGQRISGAVEKELGRHPGAPWPLVAQAV